MYAIVVVGNSVQEEKNKNFQSKRVRTTPRTLWFPYFWEWLTESNARVGGLYSCSDLH
jgi:uncharacterized protein YycO